MTTHPSVFLFFAQSFENVCGFFGAFPYSWYDPTPVLLDNFHYLHKFKVNHFLVLVSLQEIPPL